MEGNTPLHYAAKLGHISLIKWIVSQKNINDLVYINNKKGESLLTIAEKKEIVDLIVNSILDSNDSATNNDIEKNHRSEAEELRKLNDLKECMMNSKERNELRELQVPNDLKERMNRSNSKDTCSNERKESQINHMQNRNNQIKPKMTESNTPIKREVHINNFHNISNVLKNKFEEKIKQSSRNDNPGKVRTEHSPNPEINNNQKEPKKINLTNFIIYDMLGKGSFGEVYLIRYKDDHKLYALKVLNKQQILSQNLVKYAITERNVLSGLKHPFIVKLNFAFQTANKLYLILDYCPGGDLAQVLMKEKRLIKKIF